MMHSISLLKKTKENSTPLNHTNSFSAHSFIFLQRHKFEFIVRNIVEDEAALACRNKTLVKVSGKLKSHLCLNSLLDS